MRLIRVAAVVVVVLGLALIVRPYAHGLSFVIRAADLRGTARTIADWDTHPFREREIALATARGSIRARVYEPAGTSRRTTLLVSGLHPSGIDEPRLVRLARQVVAERITVVTPDIPELSRFEITPGLTDTIEQAARSLSSDAALAPDHRIGLMGISFSGGLSIVAAGRKSLADRVAYVFALGGHDDLPRVLRYLCTGAEPMPTRQLHLKDGEGEHAGDAFVRPPHDYGVTVILLAVADRIVPSAQVAPLREAIRRYLWASALDGGVDRAKAPAEFEAARAMAKRLPEPAATLMRYVNDRDVIHLGPRLLPYIQMYGGDPALSPSKSAKPAAPVFLLHGFGDNVIPPIESEYLADELRGHTPVRLLVSGLISHAEADQPVRANDVLQLAGFWGDLLGR